MDEFLKQNPQFANLSPDVLIAQYHMWLENKALQAASKSNVKPKPTKSTDVVIEDKVYTIAHWNVTKTYRNIPKIGRYFVVPASTIIGEMLNTPQGQAPDFTEAIPTCLLYLFNTMETEDIIEFFRLCLEDVTLDGKSVTEDFDDTFEDQISDVLALIAEVIRINYVVPFSRQGASSSLMKLFAVAKPMMEVTNLK